MPLMEAALAVKVHGLGTTVVLTLTIQTSQ
jgi:hypothetical protein